MSRENVFNFVTIRPAQRVESTEDLLHFARYSQSEKSPLQEQIEALTDDRRAGAIELALAYMASDNYISESLSIAAAAEQASTADSVAEAREKAEAVLGIDDLAAFLDSQETATLRDNLWDSLYAQALAPDNRPDDRSHIYNGVRALHYLTWLAAQEDDEAAPSLRELQKVTPIIPSGLIPPADIVRENPEEVAAIERMIEELKGLHARLQATQSARNDLKNVNRLNRAQILRNFPEANIDLTSAEKTENVIALEPLARPVLRVPPVFVVEPPVIDRQPSAESPPTIPVQARSVIMPPQKPWVFEEFGQINLKSTTLEILEGQRAEFEELEPVEIIHALEKQMNLEATSFLKMITPRALPYLVELEEFHEIAKLVPIPLYPYSPVLPDPFPEPGSPAERGIRPLGVGDLLVVQQDLLGYEAGEVAHIENVLQSEHKTRTHSRLRETEEIIVIETEQLEETEKDLQSTERFELQKESENTIQTQMSFGAGLSVTASYGFVSATATANFAYNQSRSESNRLASQFAKEVVDRSVSRIMQRTREERTRRTLERFEEINEHGFDNKDGDGHVIGIYRWVDKYYRARTINYGRRLMIEFIVPEPAAFYIHTQSNQQLAGVTVPKPEKPTIWGRPLRPDDLTSSNYEGFIAEYSVSDADPYPSPTTRVGAAFAEATSGGQAQNIDYAKTSDNLVIPPGYSVQDVFGQFGTQGYEGYFADCYVAGETFGSITAFGLEGKVPISIMGWLSAFHVNLVAICSLKNEAIEAWQLKTYTAIMTAYERALADYEEAVAAAEIQSGVDIQGRNPDLNRKVERDELKKGSLRLLTDEYARTRVDGTWRFNELFNAMQAGGAYGYPEFDIDEALVEGQIIQFFEQAFEWNNMTYRFYPYFWGSKSKWKDTVLIDDTDPLFTDFLRAGAARVVIPVHSAYTEAVLHYLYTNEIWNGDRPPTLDDPLYISIVDEIKADTGADIRDDLPECSDDSSYPCVIEEWEVKVPTNLVILQQEGVLPPRGHLPPNEPEVEIIALHTVVAGDTLSDLALHYYGSAAPDKWGAIYEANIDIIGDDPSLIIPGQVLKIPRLDDES